MFVRLCLQEKTPLTFALKAGGISRSPEMFYLLKRKITLACGRDDVLDVFISPGVWVVSLQVHHHQSSLALFPVLIAPGVVLLLPISEIAISLPSLRSDHHSLPLLHLWDSLTHEQNPAGITATPGRSSARIHGHWYPADANSWRLCRHGGRIYLSDAAAVWILSRSFGPDRTEN